MSPYEIEWWEAAILFSMYLGYCFVMVNNVRLFTWVSKTFLGQQLLLEEGEEGEEHEVHQVHQVHQAAVRAHAHTHKHMHMHTHMHVHTHTHMHTHMHARTCTHAHARTHMQARRERGWRVRCRAGPSSIAVSPLPLAVLLCRASGRPLLHGVTAYIT